MALPHALTITPLSKPFTATFAPPGSKSLTNRALLLAALANGTSRMSGVLFADDSKRMLEALLALGFKVEVDEKAATAVVHGLGGKFPAPSAELFLGNAGTATRFLSAALALGAPGSAYVVDGIPRMRERPIGQLVEPLRRLGAKVECPMNEGFPPLKIHGGGLKGGALTLKPTLSSQYISALLQVAPLLPEGLAITFDGPCTSRPYVEMTLRLMAQFGAKSTWEGDTIRVSSGGYKAFDYPVEPDASSASYPLAAAAIIPGSKVTVPGLGKDSLQGDAAFALVLGKMGCRVTQTATSTTLEAPADGILRGIDVDMNGIPDMAQTLACVAVFAEGPTTIRDVGNLRVKETDRMEALRVELTKLGAQVTVNGDDLTVVPPAGGKTKAAEITTYDDHRMAMAFSLIGRRNPGVTILDPGCCSKTWPTYFEDMNRITGANGKA